MTTPDPTPEAPLLTEDLMIGRCVMCGTPYGRQIVDAVTPAVLAACQGATVAQQAELIGGEVVFGAHLGVDVAQAVGNPREDPS